MKRHSALLAALVLTLAGCEGAGGPVTGGAVSSVAPPPPSPPAAAIPAPVYVAPSPAPVPLAVEGKALRAADAPAASKIIAPPPPGPDSLPPQRPPQSGLLTAGDYDDVLNPGLYKAYLDTALQKAGHSDLPFVDAADRIAVRVTDRLGKPVPFADISAQGITLRTGASGVIYLYPGFDGLEPGDAVSVSLGRAQALTKPLPGSGETLSFILTGDAPKVQKLDILLTLDATGSMADEMRFLQTELTAIMQRVAADNPGLDIHAGLIVYRDKGDAYVTRDFNFTGDLAAFNTSLAEQSARGGGDFPEAMHTALQKGEGLSWRPDAIKVNLLVADAPPHDRHISETWQTALNARSAGIHVVPLAASGVDPTAEFIMRAMGQITGGRYLFLTDDSGVGNPHAEPDVDCYIVTRLDGLVQRVLESLVKGQRVEPEGDAVIRTVGLYQAGVCAVDNRI